jgi:hypothetical protein
MLGSVEEFGYVWGRQVGDTKMTCGCAGKLLAVVAMSLPCLCCVPHPFCRLSFQVVSASARDLSSVKPAQPGNKQKLPEAG